MIIFYRPPLPPLKGHLQNNDILSRASEAGSPTNPPWAPGSGKTRGQGSYTKF